MRGFVVGDLNLPLLLVKDLLLSQAVFVDADTVGVEGGPWRVSCV